nr:hypothetical protein Iba_chr07bCG6950 [Ipomoea batatas]
MMEDNFKKLVTWRCVRRKTNRGRSTNDTKPRPSAAIAAGIANHRRTPLSRLPSPPPSASATVARKGERGVESPSDQPLGGRIRSRCLQKRRRLHRRRTSRRERDKTKAMLRRLPLVRVSRCRNAVAQAPLPPPSIARF